VVLVKKSPDQTTPSAPLKVASRLFLDVFLMSRPPETNLLITTTPALRASLY
jgi:hypothetical protein